MSRIEDADKIRRSIERGDPQPTAMSKDQREAWKGIKAMTQDDKQRALEAFKLEFGLEEETLEQVENGYKLLWPAWRNSWEYCLQSKASQGAGDGWQPIETAPKDGSAIWLLSAASEYDFGPEHGGIVKHRPKCAVGSWNPDGDSWVDEHGKLGGDCVTLAVTGTWSSGGGWFQPNEVTHWMPLPKPPETKL